MYYVHVIRLVSPLFYKLCNLLIDNLIDSEKHIVNIVKAWIINAVGNGLWAYNGKWLILYWFCDDGGFDITALKAQWLEAGSVESKSASIFKDYNQGSWTA